MKQKRRLSYYLCDNAMFIENKRAFPYDLYTIFVRILLIYLFINIVYLSLLLRTIAKESIVALEKRIHLLSAETQPCPVLISLVLTFRLKNL